MSGFFERSQQALRMLRRHKSFSALAIISLAMAIALNTTMYGVLDTMIAPKLLMKDHERLYTLQFYGNFRRIIPPAEIDAAIRQGITFAEGVTGSFQTWGDRLVEGGGNVFEATIVTILPNYFRVVGVRASNGRLLSEADVGSESRPVVVSERVWKELFPNQRKFEPAAIVIDGEPRTMVGTLPYQADFPDRNTGIWELPLATSVALRSQINLVRLKADVSPERAGAELETLRLRFAQRTGESRVGDSGFRFWRATKRPFRVGRFHFALVGSVVAVMLVACANLANLQLARGVSRARELATRAAVGATRGDIIRQLVVESAWLALGGLLLGAVLTAWGMKIVDASVPPMIFQYVTHPQVSWRVVLFAVGATLFCLMLVGLLPAIRLSRVDINDLLKSGAGTGTSRSARRQYGALVAFEIALALSVLCSASLLTRAAVNVLSFDGGLEGRGLVSTRISVRPNGPADRRTQEQWSAHLIQQALAVRGITSAAVIRGERPRTRAIALDDPGGASINHQVYTWGYNVVTPEYLRTMRIPIVRGRNFTTAEFAEQAVIVDRSTAAWLWPGAEPIGRLIKLDSAHARTPWLKVVGVAGNMDRWFNPNEYERTRAVRPHLGAVYVLQAHDTVPVAQPPRDRRYSASFSLLVRGTGDPLKIPTVLRQGLGDLGPTNFVSYPVTWEQGTGIDTLRAKHSFMASLFMLFGLMALALAALGVYAIIAHMVAQRTREFGVRIAVGAATRDIRELVIREGNVLALAGIAVGLLITAYSAGFVREFVFSDDDRYDSRVFAVVCLALFAVAWLASYIPARRAMRINPVEALRND